MSHWTDSLGLRRRPPRRAAVLFWAERDPNFALASAAVALALLAPLALFAPAAFIVAAAILLALRLGDHLTFRFELTREALHLRAALLAPRLAIPLAEIEAAEVETSRTFRGGLLALRWRDRMLYVAGIRAPREAADAIRKLQQADAA